MEKKRTRNPKGASVRISAYVPIGTAERINSIADENGESVSSVASRLLAGNADIYALSSMLTRVLENQDMLLFSMEVLGARMDELAKFMAVRMPSREGLSDEQKQELRLSAQRLCQAMSKSAADTAMAYRTGASALDPLGIDQAVKKFSQDPTASTEDEE